jgi:hypothetical protein
MVDLIEQVRRLRDATTRGEVLNALWNLRDSAFDRPQSWQALTAETLLQALAETIENIPADDRDLPVANLLLARAFEKVLGP